MRRSASTSPPGMDLTPILEAEKVDKFSVSGSFLGSPQAMATAECFGSTGFMSTEADLHDP